jgi:L-ascorbate metabolism protein UlaG (beta-lactamase superfamily)
MEMSKSRRVRMRILIPALLVFFAGLAVSRSSPPALEEDIIPTKLGDLKIVFVGHASLVFECAGKVIHVDPVSGEGDYRTLPKADLILITHDHSDHLDPAAIGLIRRAGTRILVSRSCAGRLPGSEVLTNGQSAQIMGFSIEAVAAYNLVHKRPDGNPFHPKGNGNGYVIGFGDKRVYVAGDTEPIPEMKALKGVDVAFLPVNLPYTMDLGMAVEAVRMIRPRIFYPYHYGSSDIGKLAEDLKNEKDVEVRIRKMS